MFYRRWKRWGERNGKLVAAAGGGSGFSANAPETGGTTTSAGPHAPNADSPGKNAAGGDEASLSPRETGQAASSSEDLTPSPMVLNEERRDLHNHPLKGHRHFLDLRRINPNSPVGRFNGCHLNSRLGMLMYGGDEKFYGEGIPDPHFMSRELWILNKTAADKPPTWSYGGPLRWDFHMAKRIRRQAFRQEIRAAVKEHGVRDVLQAAAAAQEPDLLQDEEVLFPGVGVENDGVVSSSSSSSGIRSSNTTTADSAATGQETPSSGAPAPVPRRHRLEHLRSQFHELGPRVRNKLPDVSPDNKHFLIWLVERAAPACAFDGKYSKFGTGSSRG